MGENKKGHWYNYSTRETDYREAPTTDEEAIQYLPQMGGPGLYRIFREHEGLDIIEAMIKVLKIAGDVGA